MAAPFVQGQLRNEPLSLEIESSCAHCGAALHLEIDAELKIAVREPNAEPLVFEPELDWSRFRESNILDGY